MSQAMQFGIMNSLRTGNAMYDLIMVTIVPSVMVLPPSFKSFLWALIYDAIIRR